MNAEQIKKLAAAGLSVEQIAAVAEIMEPKFWKIPLVETKPPPNWPSGARAFVSSEPVTNDYGFQSESQFDR